MEAGGERGKKALRTIEHIFHRVEAIWKPIATEEGFEIVRRRLFTSISDEQSRDEVCRAFADLYISSGGYPSGTKESSYFNRLKAAYPIHPEVFDRLYEDWAVLENFQRTRGVLRLMAMVLHRLWSDGNKDLMIMPSSFPLYDTQIVSELIRYLPQGWEPVVERDVDGGRSAPISMDERNSLFGSVQAARRVARSIFLGSAPTSSGQRIRGINIEHIRLGCCQPGQQVGRFDDALRHLNDQLHYLYSGNKRFWYDTQTNLRREAEDRMSRFSQQEHIFPELRKRLGLIFKGNSVFAGVHIFCQHEDVVDDTQLRLVVLLPRESHIAKKESRAVLMAKLFVSKRGNQPRLNQNRLIFLAADEDTKSAAYEQASRFLAWQSILDYRDALNLDQHRIREATRNKKEAEERLLAALQETYKWILSPHQEKEKKGLSDIQWEEIRVATTDVNPIESITHKLKDAEVVIPNWAGIHLSGVLSEWYFKENVNDVCLSTLWNYFCRYLYLPRLVDEKVLVSAVADGVQSKDFFGYASGKEENRYSGLKFGADAMIFIDSSSIIVRKEIAQKQIETEQAMQPEGATSDGKTGPKGGESGGRDGGEEGVARTSKRKHFYGTAELNPTSATLEFDNIMREVVQHFSSKVDVDVTIKVEVEASSRKGFDETTQRVVKENSRTLGFSQSEFEEE